MAKKKNNEGEIQAEEFLEKYKSVLTKKQQEMIEELMPGVSILWVICFNFKGVEFVFITILKRDLIDKI